MEKTAEVVEVREMRKNIFMGSAIIMVLSLVWCVGYIPRYPIWVDDFSCLSDDVFSRIIINGRFKSHDARRGVGFSAIDLGAVRRLSDSLFVGKECDVVMNTFNTYGCGCDVVSDAGGKKYLICKFRRQWKIKNCGMYHESEGVAFWTKPIVVVTYKFCLEKNGLIRSINDIAVIDATPSSSLKDDQQP